MLTNVKSPRCPGVAAPMPCGGCWRTPPSPETRLRPCGELKRVARVGDAAGAHRLRRSSVLETKGEMDGTHDKRPHAGSRSATFAFCGLIVGILAGTGVTLALKYGIGAHAGVTPWL